MINFDEMIPLDIRQVVNVRVVISKLVTASNMLKIHHKHFSLIQASQMARAFLPTTWLQPRGEVYFMAGRRVIYGQIALFDRQEDHERVSLIKIIVFIMD